MRELPELFENNRKWVDDCLAQDPEFFSNRAKSQSPKYLWIGCSDSRIPANQVVGLQPGELFVHRNIANLCVHTDMNFLSVLEYAVQNLKVEHVIVCGHYGCGGVNAALASEEVGLVDNWLRNIRDLAALHADDLEACPDEESRARLMVELNVRRQVRNICHTSIVQTAWKSSRHLCVHAWVYDLASGLLKDLDETYTEINQITNQYRLK